MIKGFNSLGIELSDIQIQQFNTYYEMLVEKNKVMNLTAIVERDEVNLKHFLDSVALSKVYDLERPLKVIDLGTGAGFPGIPLKIVFPNLDITLMDSLNKRIKFLQEVIDELELDNINAVHARAEELARDKEYRESYDLCVSRAVANLSTLSEYCLPFVKVGGVFVSYKADGSEEEINNAKPAIKKLGGKIQKVETLLLPGSDINRSFVIIDKCEKTPKIYPRKAGTPTKEPLS